MSDRRFVRLPQSPDEETLSFSFEGRPLSAGAGCTVAAALLQAGVLVFRRSAVSGVPRAPYCMMGACFDCLVEIDGVPNRQACLIELRDGMAVREQRGPRRLPGEEVSVD